MQPGTTCSTSNFPITNYSVVVTQAAVMEGEGQMEVGRVTRNLLDPTQPLTTPVALELSALEQDQRYQIFVRVCIPITCRETPPIPACK